MEENIKNLVTKKRGKELESVCMIFNNIDITYLFIKSPDCLTLNDKDIIIDYYTVKGKKFVESACIANKILPFAACVLISLGCDSDYWTNIHNNYVKRNEEILKKLNMIFADAQENGSKTLSVVENFGVVLRSRSCIGCFCSGDVDLSAGIEEKNRIISVLKKNGFDVDYRTDFAKAYKDQITMLYNSNIIEGGYWINVMWQPVARSFLVQDKYNIRLAKERLNATYIDNTKVRVLNETSLMYFCALHIASGHYYTLTPGLRLYVDIDRLARACDIDWKKISAWMKEDNAGIRIAVVLYICNRIFRSPIPGWVYETELQGKRAKRLIRYLYNHDANKIQGNSNKFSRLYIEIMSDNINILQAIVKRVVKIFQFKMKIYYVAKKTRKSCI